MLVSQDKREVEVWTHASERDRAQAVRLERQRSVIPRRGCDNLRSQPPRGGDRPRRDDVPQKRHRE